MPNLRQLSRAFVAVALMCCSPNAVYLLSPATQRLILLLSGLGCPPSDPIFSMAGKAGVPDLTSRNASHEMKDLRSVMTRRNLPPGHLRTALIPQSRDRDPQSASMDDAAWFFQAALEVVPAAIAR